MKKIFFCVAALFPFIATAQIPNSFSPNKAPASVFKPTPVPVGIPANKFIITGKIGDLSAPAKVYIVYQVGASQVLDSASITNGNFLLSGEVPYPTTASILLDHKGQGPNLPKGAKFDALNLYVDKGNITVTGTDNDSIATAKITGSQINEDNSRLAARLSSVNARIKKLNTETIAAPIEQQTSIEFQNTAQAKRKALQTEQEGILKTFVKGNPNSYLSLLTLISLGGPSADPAVIEPLYNGLSDSLKTTLAGKLMANSINGLKAVAIGNMAPDFAQPDAAGLPIKLSSFRGKYVLIDFWASWCGPCRLENPNLVRAYNKYKGKKFTILGVSLDPEEKKVDWLTVIQFDGLTWPQVSDLKYWNNAAAALYFVRSIPQNFLIDPTGKIVAKNLRGDDLDNKLAEIFGKI